MLFSDLQLSPSILQAAVSGGYTAATPIQAQAIPHILAGRDVLGCAKTGTGKTAAFAMPLLHRLAQSPRAAGAPRLPRCLVLCPTRELASQILGSFMKYGVGLPLRYSTIFGGVGQSRQVDALRRGVDVVIATPGRLIDLMEQGCVNLSAVEVLVLDESDRMLDMGFIQPIRRIVGTLPAERQTLLFSATMAPEIRRLTNTLLKNPAIVHVAPAADAVVKIEESVYRVEKPDKPALLAHLVKALPMYRTIVFTKTKHGADRVVQRLRDYGIHSEAIHGNKSQNARQRALAQFTANRIPVLVATDVASRGISVEGITHVVNYDLTHEPDTYVHRIGRTGRAGASGAAISFCDREEVSNLRAIERSLRRPIVSIINPLAPAAGEPAPQRERERPSGEPNRRASSHSPQGKAPASRRGFKAQPASPSRSHSDGHGRNGDPRRAVGAGAGRSGPRPGPQAGRRGRNQRRR